MAGTFRWRLLGSVCGHGRTTKWMWIYRKYTEKKASCHCPQPHLWALFVMRSREEEAFHSLISHCSGQEMGKSRLESEERRMCRRKGRDACPRKWVWESTSAHQFESQAFCRFIVSRYAAHTLIEKNQYTDKSSF